MRWKVVEKRAKEEDERHDGKMTNGRTKRRARTGKGKKREGRGKEQVKGGCRGEMERVEKKNRPEADQLKSRETENVTSGESRESH